MPPSAPPRPGPATTSPGAPTSYIVTFAPEGYATFYDSRADLVLTEGMKAYVVTGSGAADDNGVSKLTYKKIADGNGNSDVVPAGTAVLQCEADWGISSNFAVEF